MARLRYNGLTATLGAALTSGDTTITFSAALTHSGGTSVPTITGSDYIPLSILATSDPDSAVAEVVYLTAYTSGATTGTITRAQESFAAAAHASGVVAVHAPTTLDFTSSGGGLKDFAHAKRTSGDVAINSTTFVNVDTGLDLVMTAAAGDVIECTLSATGQKDATGSTYLVFDFHTIVGGSPVNSVSSEAAAGAGLANSFPGWGSGVMGQNTTRTHLSGSKRYTLQAGDISTGTVTLRLRAFCGAASTIKASDPILYVQATNLGPQL